MALSENQKIALRNMYNSYYAEYMVIKRSRKDDPEVKKIRMEHYIKTMRNVLAAFKEIGCDFSYTDEHEKEVWDAEIKRK